MKTIVISDLHLGMDDRCSETVANRPKLAAFIGKVADEHMADELVIAGDFLDQWMYPASAELPANMRDHYLACAANNQVVIDALKRCMAAGIPVVYVPGNHDMTLTHEILAEILPGVRQARDVPGLGRYRTGLRGEVVIEHSHRYELMCAPDTITNAELAEPGEFPILPFGFPLARVGVTSALEGFYGNPGAELPEPKVFPEPPAPTGDDPEYSGEYAYWKVWTEFLGKLIPVKEAVDEPFVHLNAPALHGVFSLADIVPSMQPDGRLEAKIYRDVINHWDEVQRRNLVPAPVSAAHSLAHAYDNEERIAELPQRVYFRLDPSVDVVVFGHTHVAGYMEYEGYDKVKIFANSGCWLDDNQDDPLNTCTFVLVESTPSGTTAEALKVLGAEAVEAIVPVENDHIRPLAK